MQNLPSTFKTNQVILLTMCSLIIFLFTSFPALANLPEYDSKYVNDFANVISDSEASNIRSKLTHLDDKEHIEMTVVTIQSVKDYNQKNIKDFSQQLFDKWEVGKRPDDNGVMIVVAVKDRKVRIQMGKGYGNQYDNAMKAIIQTQIAPAFKDKRFGYGIYNATSAITEELTDSHSGFFNMSSWFWYGLMGVFVVLAAGVMKFFGISGDPEDNYDAYYDDESSHGSGSFSGGNSGDGGADSDW